MKYFKGIFGVILFVSIICAICDPHLFRVESAKTNTLTMQKSHTWIKQDSLAYAHDQVMKNAESQFTCLADLWGKESAWNPKAFNPIKVMGKNAGGIGQLLGMSPLTPPTEQIDRGLGYIYFRYQVPCKAWYHWEKEGWY